MTNKPFLAIFIEKCPNLIYYRSMANSISNNKERLEAGTIQKPESPSRSEQEKRLNEATKQFVESLEGVVESAENQEVAEFVEGNVSETSREGKGKLGQGGQPAGAATAASGATAVAIPSIEIMQVQVATKIQKEIRVLENEAKRLMAAGGGSFSPHQLTQSVAQIRNLREILAGLVYATADALKALWLKYVKGAP